MSQSGRGFIIIVVVVVVIVNDALVHSPKELLDPKNTDLIEPVGIFCIASFSAVMGDPDPLFHQFVVNEDNSPKNWASIGAIVLWKTGEVSHYFAGDAFFRAEESMQKWIGGHVTSMKLSHHGSSTSTPPKLLDTFKPKNILASCGKTFGFPRMHMTQARRFLLTCRFRRLGAPSLP